VIQESSVASGVSETSSPTQHSLFSIVLITCANMSQTKVTDRQMDHSQVVKHGARSIIDVVLHSLCVYSAWYNLCSTKVWYVTAT